ncbi:MAG TPA: ABC transporter permease [Candidatus Hydrogenedentes bacterium]|jgi:putative ABC transport system permease protein|nr:ABC transporter permease [Candidatus Hydrogenedentota bacterium]MDY0032393.1 ABC transporter permease [FCB group bacterium]HNZ16884.1 ABC transporter permease [Candidatus Hydrogenedentota bacterium]HOH33493.1 ABC transporter permease [Candidatus Hydrogenedentota bacterium]HPA03266.1 ABC transporter permease [Candidatus Hydrogenedentota bacterium]
MTSSGKSTNRQTLRKAIGAGRMKLTIKLGLKSLWLHRLRSLLTVLGIVFGVCSVIAMLAIGEGASYEAQEQIRSLGSNNIIVRSVKPPEEKSSTSQRTWLLEYGITYADLERIRATLPGVEILVPARIMRQDVWNGGRRIDCDLYGTVPWYPEVNNHRVARGRFFTETEMNDGTYVAVLDAGVESALFPIDPAIGNTLRAGSHYYRVIGVMEPQSARITKDGASTPPANNANGASGAPNRIYVPLNAARKQFGEILVNQQSGSFEATRVELHEATVKVARLEDVVDTAQVIADLLAANHRKTDYEVVVPLELLRQAERTKRIFNIVLGAIAAISLLVGGIGIMNIMLASVTERTREIGIRRALGAKRRDIIIQFLVETVLLSGAGGVLGVILGIAIPMVITWFAGMKTIVTLWSPFIAFSISAMVGVVFGLYPALRAANMDPVEALRHE